MKFIVSKLLYLFLFLFTQFQLFSNTKTCSIDTIGYNSYQFIVQDSPAQLFTMKQFNQNYLSVNRFLSHNLYKSIATRKASLIQYLSEIFFLLPLSHEEGHRSVLTSLSFGSISQPYFNSKGAAYVKGVLDRDLISIKTNDFPNYIRLHTAGLESDYMLSNRMEKLLLFKDESKQNLFWGYTFRKLSLISYYTFSLIPNINPKLKEETNELERDIVGHDVYGAIKNLHRPNERFYRYTNYDDLSNEELRFLKRVGYRALINIATPVLFKQLTVVNKPDLKLSLSAGYTMSPFGDFIDENIFILLKNKYKIHTYLRQFENKQTWFPAGGISLTDYNLSPKFSTSIATHAWAQPENLDFNTSKSDFGGAVDVLFKYKVLNLNKGNSVSLDLGMIYKTKGFLPEEVQLNEHFGVRLGCTLNLIPK